MALAEVRAVLHRTANRCLVQEDAKRAPKLACCSSIPTSVKQAETAFSASRNHDDVPGQLSVPYNHNLNSPFHSSSPNSKWWLYLQPNNGCPKSSIEEQFSSRKCSMDICQKNENSGSLARSDDNPDLIDQISQCRNMATGDKLDFGAKEPFSPWNCNDSSKLEVKDKELTVEDFGPDRVPKHADEICFNPKSWIGAEKNAPWWRTADTDELASLVAQRSLDYIENCDLPMPQNTRVKNDLDVDICRFGRDGIARSFPDPKHDAGGNRHHDRACSPTRASSCQNHGNFAVGQSASSAENPLRIIPTDETMVENDASKAQLMEALCHSQTRAREAERAAKQACAEKEHVVKLVFRQASHLFAYKQWLHILQLESMYLQFLNNSSQSVGFLPTLSWTPQRTKKAKTSISMPSTRKRTKHCSPPYEGSKYTVVFTVGIGLAGAGFLLGWSIAWMFPSW